MDQPHTVSSSEPGSTRHALPEKMLAIKAAHEINNIAMSVSANLKMLSACWNDIQTRLSTPSPEPSETDRNDRLLREIPFMLDEMREGLQLISRIGDGLKSCSIGPLENRHPVQVEAVIESALHLANAHFENHVHVVKKIAPDLPPVRADRQMLIQVFLNFFLNAAAAIRGTERRGTLTIEAAHSPDNRVVVTVEDTGVGIPPEHMNRLFTPFFTTRREHGGTGLGLFIAYEMIALHEGSLKVRSHPGQGATFIVTLPTCPP